jgi:hypothetical protein
MVTPGARATIILSNGSVAIGRIRRYPVSTRCHPHPQTTGDVPGTINNRASTGYRRGLRSPTLKRLTQGRTMMRLWPRLGATDATATIVRGNARCTHCGAAAVRDVLPHAPSRQVRHAGSPPPHASLPIWRCPTCGCAHTRHD